MKKSTKKVINYLRQYIGHKVFRTKPVGNDWSFTFSKPILLVGFTSDGCIIYRNTDIDAEIFNDKEYVLPICYTDRNWITYKKILNGKNNELNKWRGKKITRIFPTSIFHDYSYMFGNAPTLISASKHHMIIMTNNNGTKKSIVVLNSDYINPEDWVLAE